MQSAYIYIYIVCAEIQMYMSGSITYEGSSRDRFHLVYISWLSSIVAAWGAQRGAKRLVVYIPARRRIVGQPFREAVLHAPALVKVTCPGARFQLHGRVFLGELRVLHRPCSSHCSDSIWGGCGRRYEEEEKDQSDRVARHCRTKG